MYFFPLRANLVTKGTKSVNLLPPVRVLVVTMSSAPHLAPLVPPRYQNFSIIFRDWPFNSMPGKPSAIPVCWFADASHLKLLSSSGLPLIPLHLLFTRHYQNWQRMELLLLFFLQTLLEDWLSSVTFPAFSLLIIVFVFLKFTLNTFNSSNPSQASGLLFKLLKSSIMPSHHHKVFFFIIWSYWFP